MRCAASDMSAEDVSRLAFPFRVGSLDCASLSDGFVVAPVALTNPEVPADELRVFLDAHGDTEEFRRLQISCLTLRLPSGKRVLVDAGFGNDARAPNGEVIASVGQIVEALRAMHVDPEDVDHILISHIHPDHIGGLFDGEGRARFPNASYHVSNEE